MPRSKPIQNRHLTFDEQNFDSEYGLLVTTSPWCLFRGEEKIVDWNDDGSPYGPIDSGLKLLRDTLVSAVTFDPATGNLEMHFDPCTFILEVHGVDPDLDPDDDGYSLFFPDHVVSRKGNGDYEIQTSDKG